MLKTRSSNFLPVGIVVIFIIGCTMMITDNKLIFGEWTGVEWLVENSLSNHDPGQAKFSFDDEGNYTYQYGGDTEKGKFTFANNQLFTTPDGGIKIMVKVPRIEQDTMVFEMNRGGQSERLTLIRSN